MTENQAAAAAAAAGKVPERTLSQERERVQSTERRESEQLRSRAVLLLLLAFRWQQLVRCDCATAHANLN